MNRIAFAFCVTLSCALGAPSLSSALTYDPLTAKGGNVTPGIQFGSGNDNGSWTIKTKDNLEVGLRAKLRYDEFGNPQNKTNYDGVDTYSFDPADGAVPTGKAIWNFEYSIFTGLGGSIKTLDDYFVTFDLKDPDGGNYLAGISGSLLAANTEPAPASLFAPENLSQDSQNIGFFPINSALNASLTGMYTAKITVSNCGDTFCTSRGDDLVSTSIKINQVSGVSQVPAPAALPLLASGIAAFAWFRRRQRRHVAA